MGMHFWCDLKFLGGYAHNRAVRLGNGITGACFQAPRAAPG